MKTVPFNQRFGLNEFKPIDDSVPNSARVALSYLIADMDNKNYVKGSYNQSYKRQLILDELYRCGRFTEQGSSLEQQLPFPIRLIDSMQKMRWEQIYIFLERFYERLLSAIVSDENNYEWVEEVDIADVQKYYTDELNLILAEENIAYHFVEGKFQNRGRAQTQKTIQRVGLVLINPKLIGVRNHYNKARKFFDERPEPDVENCVKEALCSLEACLEIMTERPASKDFTNVVKKLQGNGQEQIPTPIAQGMIKLHAYRGSGLGVAHAALTGTRVTKLDAELVLSLVGSYITYLVDLFQQPEEEIPF